MIVDIITTFESIKTNAMSVLILRFQKKIDKKEI